MNIKDVHDLNQIFRTEAYLLNLPDDNDIIVNGITYQFRASSTRTLVEMLQKGGAIAYNIQRNPENIKRLEKTKEETGLDNWLVFAWRPTQRDTIVPAGVIATTAARGKVIIEVEQKDKYEGKILGSSIQVGFTQFPRSQNARAKIDTGANISSIHAENIQIDKQNNRVSFRAPFLSNNVLTTSLVTNQAVKSPDGGVQYRPVIALDIMINNQRIPGVEFNLNDRSHMSHDVLIGQNVLQKGKFLIDPSMESEEVDWDYLDQLLTEELKTQKESETVDENAQQLCKLIAETDLSLRDLIKYIKTQTTIILDEIRYE